MEAAIARQGKLTAKRSKTDTSYQTFRVREWSDGTIEQLLTHEAVARWVIYQGDHASDILWETSE